jgi:hypothetical protein
MFQNENELNRFTENPSGENFNVISETDPKHMNLAEVERNLSSIGSDEIFNRTVDQDLKEALLKRKEDLEE